MGGFYKIFAKSLSSLNWIFYQHSDVNKQCSQCGRSGLNWSRLH
jgi:hypothetical protein